MARVQVLLSKIIRQEPLISENRRPALRQLVERLISKMAETQHHSFTLFKVCAAHGAAHGMHAHPRGWDACTHRMEHRVVHIACAHSGGAA